MTHIDKGQIQQVFSNLVINSVQAMPEGGKIMISLNNAVLKKGEVGNLPAGNYVKITFTDEGSGIEEKHLARIFDPYYSTKKTGSGLGLATTHSIIVKHGGYIGVESQANHGTTFFIYLPASATSDSKLSRRDSADDKKINHSNARILVLDDEEMIRNLTTDLFTTHGYRVTAVEEGATAVIEYKKAMDSGSPFDLVIMDLTIPGGMGGKEAVQEILKLDPKAKCIYQAAIPLIR
jgi:CheY-like chemotaxis protein